MSLPPDPHDDDVDTRGPAGAPPPPPPPPPPAATEPVPSGAYTPPDSPAYKQSATSERPARARAESPRSTATAAPNAAAGTPQAGPRAHPAPGATTPRRKARLALAAVVVVAALGIGAAVLLLGGDESSGGSEEAAPGDQRDALGEPVEVATAFFAALEARDCEAMIDNLTAGSLFSEEQTPDETLATCEEALESGSTGFEGVGVGTITLASIEGEVATVSVDFDIGGQVSTENFELRRVDGEWKLDLPGSV